MINADTTSSTSVQAPPPTRISDEQLVAAIPGGDMRAFDEVFDRYHHQIYNFVKKQVSDHESIEDLVQEVFLRVFKSARNFDASKKFSSWIYKIALNEVKRHWKRTASRQTLSLNSPLGEESSDGERGDILEDGRAQPAEVAETELFSEQLKLLIDKLPEKQKTVVVLKIYHDLTFDEIAEICGCPLSTVLSRMRYAVSKLRRWLGIEDNGDENGL